VTGNYDTICTNFAVVRQFDDLDRVVAIRDTILTLDRRDVTRADVDQGLETPLTTREAAALFTCLQKNGQPPNRRSTSAALQPTLSRIFPK